MRLIRESIKDNPQTSSVVHQQIPLSFSMVRLPFLVLAIFAATSQTWAARIPRRSIQPSVEKRSTAPLVLPLVSRRTKSKRQLTTLNSELLGLEYSVMVTIGGQPFSLMVDTGR